ncbi:MAG: hypothetical protein KA974_09220 [Saprospiraceae bacterium]|nr:hypothetical protein [Saprospiraceae bacterium]
MKRINYKTSASSGNRDQRSKSKVKGSTIWISVIFFMVMLLFGITANAQSGGCIPLACYALHENPDDPNPGFPFYKNIGGTWTHVCNIMAAIPEIDAMVVKGDSIFLFNHTQVWVYVESSGTCSATAIGSYGGELTAVEGAALDLKTGTIYIHSGDQICKMNKQTGMAYECQTILTPENAPLGFDMADWRAEDVALNPCNGTFYMSGSVNNGVSDHIITWDPLTMTSNWIVELETVGGAGGSADGLSFNSCCELMSSDSENTYLVNQQTGLLTPADEVTSSTVDLEAFDCLVPRPPLVNDDYITDTSCILPTCYSLALKANDEDMDTQMGLYDVTILLAPLGWTYNILDQVLGLVEFCPPIGISDGTYIFEYTLCKITPCCSNDATCSANASIVITLTNCNIVPCTLTVTSATPTACDPATNTYNLAVEVTYANQPTGDITINVGGTNYNFTPDGTSPDTYTIPNLISDSTQNIQVSATFVGDATCTNTLVAYDAPAPCLDNSGSGGSDTCAITITQNVQSTCNDNGTNSITSDDYFTITVNADGTTTGGSYEVVVGAAADGTGGNILNSGGTLYGTPITVGGTGIFNADGVSTYTITIRDSADDTCKATFTTTPVSSCSSGCPTAPCVELILMKL